MKIGRVQAVKVLSMGNYCIRICKPILILLIVYEPPFVAISFDNLMLFTTYQVLFRVSRILVFTFVHHLIFSVSLLQDWMVDLWLTHVHHSCRRTYFFAIRLDVAPIDFNIIFKSFTALILWRLWRWFQHRCLVMIRILKGVTHNALLSWCFRNLGNRSLTLIQTLTTIFPKAYLWGFPLKRLIVVFQVREKNVVLLNIVKV